MSEILYKGTAFDILQAAEEAFRNKDISKLVQYGDYLAEHLKEAPYLLDALLPIARMLSEEGHNSKAATSLFALSIFNAEDDSKMQKEFLSLNQKHFSKILGDKSLQDGCIIGLSNDVCAQMGINDEYDQQVLDFIKIATNTVKGPKRRITVFKEINSGVKTEGAVSDFVFDEFFDAFSKLESSERKSDYYSLINFISALKKTKRTERLSEAISKTIAHINQISDLDEALQAVGYISDHVVTGTDQEIELIVVGTNKLQAKLDTGDYFRLSTSLHHMSQVESKNSLLKELAKTAYAHAREFIGTADPSRFCLEIAEISCFVKDMENEFLSLFKEVALAGSSDREKLVAYTDLLGFRYDIASAPVLAEMEAVLASSTELDSADRLKAFVTIAEKTPKDSDRLGRVIERVGEEIEKVEDLEDRRNIYLSLMKKFSESPPLHTLLEKGAQSCLEENPLPTVPSQSDVAAFVKRAGKKSLLARLGL